MLAADKPELRRARGDAGRVVVVPPEDGAMKKENGRSHKDDWRRDFMLYGAATHTALFPICAILVFLVSVSLPWLLKAPTTGPQKQVILYCAQDQVFAEPILAEFTKRTGITVKPVFDSEAVKTVGLANRLLAERDHPVCDLFWGNEEFRTRQLAAAGVFHATNGWTAFGQRSRRLVVRQDKLTEVFSNQFSVSQSPRPLNTGSLNTDYFSLAALTNAAFRGRISLAFPLFGTTATHFLALRQHWGESNWLVWCRALAANQPFIEEGNSHVVRRVGRGEAWIGLTDSDDISAFQREGLPIAALPVMPESLLIPNTLGLVAKPNPKPAAQRLFDYLRSPATYAPLIAAGALEPETGPGATLQPDWEAMLRDLDRATEQLKEIFRR